MQNRQNQDSPPNSIHSSWTARLRARHIPIAYKLSLVFSLIITIGMGLLGLIVTSNQSHLLEQQMQIYAGSMVKQLADSASEPILANDDLALTVMINNLVDHEGVIGASIYSKEAQPLVSSGLIPGSGILSFTNSAVPLLWSTADAEPRLLSSFIAPVQFRD
jgi:adenylate cyclase